MYSFTSIHESRNLKQARPKGQYVDLLRYSLATPSWVHCMIHQNFTFVNNYFNVAIFRFIPTTSLAPQISCVTFIMLSVPMLK